MNAHRPRPDPKQARYHKNGKNIPNTKPILRTKVQKLGCSLILMKL